MSKIHSWLTKFGNNGIPDLSIERVMKNGHIEKYILRQYGNELFSWNNPEMPVKLITAVLFEDEKLQLHSRDKVDV